MQLAAGEAKACSNLSVIKALPSTWQASLLLEGSELTTSMEPSLTPQAK